MKKFPVVRCSSLPVIADCSAAAVAPEVSIDSGSPATWTGDALHRVACLHLRGERIDFDALAAETGADLKDLIHLRTKLAGIWDRVSQYFPDPKTEFTMSRSINRVKLRGTADLVSYIPESRAIRIGDWKTGRVDVDADPQLRGYARLALEEFPQAETVWWSTIRVREESMEASRVHSREEVCSWWKGFAEEIRSPVFRPGLHCSRCHRSHECEAYSQLVRTGTRFFSQLPAEDVFLGRLPASAEDLGWLLVPTLQVARSIRKEAERFDAIVKALVVRLGGQLTDGKNSLVIREEKRAEIDSVEGFWALARLWSEGVAIRACSMSKTSISDAVGAEVPRGQKVAEIKRTLDELKGLGVMTEIPIQKLEIRRNVNSNSTNTHNDSSDGGCKARIASA